MAKVVGIRFRHAAKVYYFAPEHNVEYKKGSGVIVNTAKGMEYGVVVMPVREVSDDKIKHELKTIVRMATRGDEQKIEEYEKRTPEAMQFASDKIKEAGLDMKLIRCDFSFDGDCVVFYFSAPKRVDFRELVKVLGAHFHKRVELRQIGVRDEAQLLGGMAQCGRECCCVHCITKFNQLNIKMAKYQGLHLNPDKISGLCGRLKCCLQYENEYYSKVYPTMPKVGSKITTPEGEGVVINNDMLKMITKVRIKKGEGADVYKEFPVKDLKFNSTQKNDDEGIENLEDGVTKEDINNLLD